MPAETEPHERVWLSFPKGSALGDTPELHESARFAWSAVANAAFAFEPVTVIIDPSEIENAKTHLAPGIDIVVAELDDAWLRDNGPTFVYAQDGSVAAVNWVFNGWGQQQWATWAKDAKIGAFVANAAGAPRIDSTLVNEGGGIVCDGNGTVVVTETVQLDPFRNPGCTKSGVEAELTRTLGARQIIWLQRGLVRDLEQHGTRGHADLLVAFPRPGVALLHTQRNPEHPDFEVSKEIRAVFERTSDADGNPWRIVEVPAPMVLRDDESWVDYSYINHLPVNGGLIACAFDDPNDVEAMAILGKEYAGRTIVPLAARPIFDRGGGIHCITQHQPAARL